MQKPTIRRQAGIQKDIIFTQPELVLETSPRWTIQSIFPFTPSACERKVLLKYTWVFLIPLVLQ